MYRLDLEKAEESEIKLQTFAEAQKNQENSRKTSTSPSLTTLMPLTWFLESQQTWKIFKVMGIVDHLTSLLRNLYAGQEATVRTGHKTMDWFQIWKGVRQGYILSPWLFNLYENCIMRNDRLDKHRLKSGLLGNISVAIDMQMTILLWKKLKRN